MKLSELLETYYFHDSSIEEIQYNQEKHQVILKIELCAWMQDWYSEEEPEIENIHLIFENVIFSDLPSFEQSEYDEIANIDLLEEKNGIEGIKICINAGFRYPTITIFAKEVNVVRSKE